MECLSILRTIKENNGDMQEFRRSMATKGISVSWDPNGTKAILFANKYEKPLTPLTRECAGIVVDYVKCNVLAYPPPPVLLVDDVDLVMKDGCSIYEIDDGTAVMIYHDGEKWSHASARSYDVSLHKQPGHSINYEECMRDIFALYPEFSYDNLDPYISYTVGFHHRTLHPHEDPDRGIDVLGRAWFVAAYTREGVRTDTNIGIPKQKCCWYRQPIEPDRQPIEPDRQPDRLIQEKIDEESARLGLENTTRNGTGFTQLCAKDDAQSGDYYVQLARNAKYDWLNGQPPIYGFMFETNAARYMLESSLLRSIRLTYYNNNLMKELQEHNISNKETYLCVKYAIARSNTITTLFPHFQPTYDSAVNEMEATIIAIMNQVDEKGPVTGFAKEVYEKLSKLCKDGTMAKHRHIVREYIYSENILTMLYAQIVNK